MGSLVMACVEDCDQILIAPSITEEQRWEENVSFKDDDDIGGGWCHDSIDSKEKEWDRTNHIVAALHDMHRDFRQLGSIFQNVRLLNKYPIHKVVALDARERSSKVEIIGLVNVGGVRDELAGAHFPQAPLLGSCPAHLLV